MKKLLFAIFICTAFACQKQSITTDAELVKYKWPLTSATITPAKIVNGKAESDLIKINTASFPDGCLNNNFSLNFNANGSYSFSSTGSLCDMISFTNAKWTKNGDEIKLDVGFGGSAQIVKLKGRTITETHEHTENNIKYTTVYIYTAKN